VIDRRTEEEPATIEEGGNHDAGSFLPSGFAARGFSTLGVRFSKKRDRADRFLGNDGAPVEKREKGFP